MTETIDGIQSHKIFNHNIVKFSRRKIGKYSMAANKLGRGTVEMASRIAAEVRNKVDENICLTPEQKERFESDLIEAAKRVNDKKPLSSISNTAKSVLGFAPRGMNGFKENARNLFSNVVHGPKTITDYEIRMEARLLANEIMDNVQLRRRECENCLKNTCTGHLQRNDSVPEDDKQD